MHGATRGTAAPLHTPSCRSASCHFAADVGVRGPTRGNLKECIIITSIVHSLLEPLEVSLLLVVLPLRRRLRSDVAVATELWDSFIVYAVIVIPWPICRCTAGDAVSAALHITRTAIHPAGLPRPWSASVLLPRAAPFPMATPAMAEPGTGSLAAFTQHVLGWASTLDHQRPPEGMSPPLRRRAAGTLALGSALESCDG